MGSSCCCAVEQSTHLLLCRILVPVVSLPVQCTAFQHQGTTVLSPWDPHFWFAFVSASEAPQYFFFYAQLISLTTTSSISIYFPTNDRIFDWLVALCYCPHFAYPFIHPCTLPSSPFLDCCTINMVCTGLCCTDSILFSSIPGSETAMLCDDSIFSYWWNSHMIYHVGSNISPKGEGEFPFFFFPSLIAFIIVSLFYNCHSKGDETIPHCGFIFYFLIISAGEHFFFWEMSIQINFLLLK